MTFIRLGECQQGPNEENVDVDYDSSHRIVQLIGKRFEKETEQIKAMTNEIESLLLTVINKSTSYFRKDMLQLTDRLIYITARVEKMETVTDKIDLMKKI